jgi:hypothetical protein
VVSADITEGDDEIPAPQTRSNALMPVAELRLGGGWQMRMGRARLFVEGGLVAQAWFTAGNASRSGTIYPSVEDDSSDLQDTETGSVNDDPLGLFGVSLRLGVDY